MENYLPEAVERLVWNIFVGMLRRQKIISHTKIVNEPFRSVTEALPIYMHLDSGLVHVK